MFATTSSGGAGGPDFFARVLCLLREWFVDVGARGADTPPVPGVGGERVGRISMNMRGFWRTPSRTAGRRPREKLGV